MTLPTPLTRRATLALIAAATGSAALAQTDSSATASDAASDTGIKVMELALGDENAPIEVIEYASFTCPHCAKFHSDVFPLLKADFIDTGKIRFIYRPVYFDGPGLWADMLARCPGTRDKYFEISTILYDRQAAWSRADSQAGVAEGIISVGKQAGLDETTILACLQDSAVAEALVAEYQKNAERDGIDSTPSFMIDGVLTQNMDYAAFSKLLNDKLAPN